MDFTIPTPVASESSVSLALIHALALESHVEGGYFRRIYLHSATIPASIFTPSPSASSSSSSSPYLRPSEDFESNGEIETRAASSSIHYLLTPHSPIGHFHRNKSVILHSLHRGRGRCILINEDGRVESFVVGHGVERGEKCMWIVDGGVWRASFLEEGANGGSDGGLLITEVCKIKSPGYDTRILSIVWLICTC